MEWKEIWPAISTLLGVLIGGASSYLTQNNILNKQFNNEIERNKENLKNERFQVYNEILKIDGETLMQRQAGNGTEFNFKGYRSKIRPILYLKFHLLDKDIASLVRGMDKIMSSADFNEELTERDEDQLINKYNKIIEVIEKHLEQFRESY